ncbi:MAG: segregation/condensation protein A [Candidatus Omnitrophica bacterium]|nr:segregation/condensation protein A [Candidatus Omnitrophota bacterium]
MEETPARLPVDIPGFSGPLEMLVHLIGKHELDIFSISLSAITDKYIEIINSCEEKDLDLAGEYLVLAATLVRWKARALLPKEEKEPEEEEIDDQILEQRRLEYERFRELAALLRRREEENASIFPRSGPPPEGKGEIIEYTEVSVYDLYRTFQQIIDEIGAREKRVVTGESYSVDEKMLEIEALLEHNDRFLLSDYLRTRESKMEIIVIFLALLELIRLHEVRAVQEKNHAEIVLEKGEKLTLPLTDDEEEEYDAAGDDETTMSGENESLENSHTDQMDNNHG